MAATRCPQNARDDLDRLWTPPVETIDAALLREPQLTAALAFAATASKLDGDALGWIPRGAIAGAAAQNRLLVCKNNDDLVGFIIWANGRDSLDIYYTWVRHDARLLLHGAALVEHAKKKAARYGRNRIELWCARTLPANLFWEALHFQPITWRWGRAKNPRRHWLWRLPLAPPQPPYNDLSHSPSLVHPTLAEIHHFVGKGA